MITENLGDFEKGQFAISRLSDTMAAQLDFIYVAQWIEALSLFGSRWVLSEDSGFKSYPSRPEVYLVKNVVR